MNPRVYYTKKIPASVMIWFFKRYPATEGFTFKFYKYFNRDKTITYYGCEVRLNGELYTYHAQGTAQDFEYDFKPLAL